jgi:hypothetical protein
MPYGNGLERFSSEEFKGRIASERRIEKAQSDRSSCVATAG